MTIRWKHLIVLAVLAPLLGLAVGWSGLMSVRASTGHWAITDWFLHWVMRNSVSVRAVATGDVPPLGDPALVPGAAGHFETGCAVCHGSPAQPRPDSVLAMLPPPPDLKTVVPEWSDAELFEIVKHGVRFTGMPAWPVQSRDDEVWSMVAFLRKLPDMDAQAYIKASGLHGIGHAGEVSPLPITCESCHAEAKLSDDSYIPRLAGQSEAYLLNALKAYADKQRPSGIMQVAVGTLPSEGLPELAAYYANQNLGDRADTAHDPALVEKGRLLAEQGRAADKVPACLSCHDKQDGNPAYPKLTGQNSAYLRQQLALFHAGTRGGSSFAHLMTNAAKELKPEDIDALAAYFSQR
ncbi:c-type cytochrome (plasmid) [Aliirhizobium terrae]|uniref:c-type cytochrome n=1 Tax=Terrirhizobium terrae TaxID=2926709 RepID=UPI002576D7C6|nr:c-type cytochrome [Rhizobium sp. CC-CFT758]WJH38052.1 c-type cytochrome [Rhizobium sp. CC-CFT758]